MAAYTSTEWAERSWNPLCGCAKVSPGCAFCYAERMAARLAGMARKHPARQDVRSHYLEVIDGRGRWNRRISLIPEVLDEPLRWKRGCTVFVNSMSDLFHEDVPVQFIRDAFSVMVRCPRHTFQVLTKRSERLLRLSPDLPWPRHIWMGVSVENQDYAWRIEHLRMTAAQVKFLSLEPVLGPLPDLDLRGIHWVIVGGESGAGARPMNPDTGYSVDSSHHYPLCSGPGLMCLIRA